MPLGEREIKDIVDTIWTSMLRLEVHPSAARFQQATPEGYVSGVVYITGAWEGSVQLDLSPELAQRAATAMLGLGGYHLSRNEMEDVLGEIANITGGNIKALLPHPSKLSIPAVAQGLPPAHELPGRPLLAQVAFECGGQPLIVTLLGRITPHASPQPQPTAA